MSNDTSIGRMDKTISALKDSFNAIRTGRASAAIFDKVRVDYYGTKSPLSQVASISVPEARSIIIQPFDKSLISEIEKAIQIADLGLNPSNDGKVIRISIPPLTQERRKELIKQAKGIESLDVIHNITNNWIENPYLLFRNYSIYYFKKEFEEYEKSNLYQYKTKVYKKD